MAQNTIQFAWRDPRAAEKFRTGVSLHEGGGWKADVPMLGNSVQLRLVCGAVAGCRVGGYQAAAVAASGSGNSGNSRFNSDAF